MVASRQNKRGAPRIPYRAPVSIRKGNQPSGLPAESRDVSSRGLFFFTQNRIEEASDIELVLLMPREISPSGPQWVCCHATVVRVEQDTERGGFGIAAQINRCQALPEI
jgi:hypothetical protein